MNTPANRRLVAAATYRDYKRYVDNEADPRLIHAYIQDDNVLRGRSFTEEQVILLPGWEAHPKAAQIREAVRLRLTLAKATP